MLVDDYGHHPTEVAAVIKGRARWLAGRRLVMVYQPHRYSRTVTCMTISSMYWPMPTCCC